MGTMPTSGAISFNDLRTQLGPGSSATNVALGNYYRGGAYVPTNGSAGPSYSRTSAPLYYWLNVFAGVGNYVETYIYWNNVLVLNAGVIGATTTTYTVGSTTYTRGSIVEVLSGPTRYHELSINESINTGVPASGTISMSNMYGARNP